MEASETLFRCTEYKFAIYICIEVRMSPLSVAWAPHYLEEAELGHSHFFRSNGIWKVGGVKYLGYGMALKMF